LDALDENNTLISANLDVRNPYGETDFEHMPPEKLVNDILEKEHRITEIMLDIKDILARNTE
jgi:type I restriction enzyme M protein